MGYVTMKIGKTAAFAIGGGIILLQVAQQNGYIVIDWEKLKKNADKATEKLEETCSKNKESFMTQVHTYLNLYLYLPNIYIYLVSKMSLGIL